MEDPRIEEDADSEPDESEVGPFETCLGLFMQANTLIQEFYASKKELEAVRRCLMARFEAECNTHMGELYILKMMYDSAIKSFQKALALAANVENPDNVLLSSLSLQLASVY